MSSYIPKLWEDINTRLTADATLVALVTGGIWNTTVPNGTALPFVVYTVVDDRPKDGFDTAISEVVIQVSLFLDREAAGGGDVMSTASSALARIGGDWMDQSNSVPTFGLDRWQPTLTASGWSASILSRDGTVERHESNVLHYVNTYRVYITR